MKILVRLLNHLRLKMLDEYEVADYLRTLGATIGTGCRFHTRHLGSEPYLVTIGNECLISLDVLFVTHDGATWVGRDSEPRLNTYGRVSVGNRCFVGARAILLPGTSLGDRCIVGAGAVCKGEYPAGSVVAGVPARVICSTEDYLARAHDRSIVLPDAVFPLERGDRQLLRQELERQL